MADNKKAFITGGDRGVGRGVAKVLAESGYDIAVTYDKDDKDAQSLRKDIEALGKAFYSYQASLEKQGVPESVTSQAIKDLGRLDLLVCCAAKQFKQLPLEADVESLDYYYSLNYKSYLLCARTAARHMAAEKTGGSIIFVTSTEGLRAYKDDMIYGAFAAAVHRSAESLAMQLAPHGIRLNCVAPGATDISGDNPEKEKPEPYKYRIPMGRRAVPSDIGHMIEFLASDKADYITGMTIKVDGGLILPGMPESPAGYGWDPDVK